MQKNSPTLEEIQKRFVQKKQDFYKKLESFEISNERLNEAMEYSSQGGKNIRAMLTYAINQDLNGDINIADDIAIAMEIFHSFTLIHDDLPALDNDDLRRGKPTCHIKYGESTAIMAGNGLHTLAMYLIANCKLTPSLKEIAMVIFAKYDFNVMVGQMIDLNHLKKKHSTKDIEEMYYGKTSSLFIACLKIGALSSFEKNNDKKIIDNILSKIEKLGKNIGMLFQIQDDILDIEGSTLQIGKTPGKDKKQLKNTLACENMQLAKSNLETLFESSNKIIKSLDIENGLVDKLLKSLKNRKK
jgi:geranylgeranyl pyrophosphate synthase